MDQLPVYDFSQLGTEWNDLLTNRYFKCATDPYNVDKKCMLVSKQKNMWFTGILVNFFYCFFYTEIIPM